ncbi:MAG: hypothetical protein FJX75_21360 [Armatimonadetes bacterium]|nr:hypothetical protein [Armatimonadota bacterium]
MPPLRPVPRSAVAVHLGARASSRLARGGAVAFALAVVAQASLPAAVAVLNDPQFPYFGTACGLTPPDVVSYLREIGLQADLLDPEQLADPAVFTAARFRALVHLYGNTFPLDAAENLRRFHHQGGGFIATSVPFCHPCRQVGAADWTYVAADSDSIERSAEGAQGGTACLRLQKDSTPSWTGAYSVRVPTAPGTTYRVGGWVRAEGAPGSQEIDALYLRFWGKGGEFLGQWGPRLPQDAREWQLITCDVQAPERAETMDICLGFWGSPGTVWLDDVLLATANPLGPNLIANPGFEQPGGQWLDLGHQQEWMRHDHLGSGEFHTPGPDRGPLTYRADADALGLGLLDWPRWAEAWGDRFVTSQSLDPGSLPREDEVVSILDYRDGDSSWPVIGLTRHHCAEFSGATDAWVGGQLFAHIGYYDPVDLREVVARAAIAVTGAGPQASRKADRLYRRDRPPTNLTPVSEPKPFPGLFPKSPPPARELVVADLRRSSLDEQILLTSLQGLVNRSQPRLYFILNDFPGAPSPDERWLTWLKERGDIDSVRRVEDPPSLLQEFRDAYRGVVVTDPFVPATANVATMIASTEGLLIASPRLANQLNLSVRCNLQNRWPTNAAAMQWAVDTLWPKLNHHVLAYNAPDWPFLIDYLVAHKAFSFWITGPVDGASPAGQPLAEQLVIERLLAKAPPNIGCLGAPYNGVGVGTGEGPGVTLLTRYAKFLAWSAQNANLTVHSAAASLPSPFRRGAGGEASLSPLLKEGGQGGRDAVYLTLLISDGDAPINWYSFFAARYWDDPLRGTFPLTWSVGPSVYDLLPDVMDYYYSRANETDCFVAACSGAGYCYPDAFASQYADSDAIFRDYLALTDASMQRLGLQGVWTHTATGERLAAFARDVPAVSFMLPDYGRLPGTTAGNANEVLADHVPIFRALTTFNPDLGDAATMKLMLDDIRRYTPAERPAFMHVFVQCYPWTPSKLRTMLDRLGPEYVPVRADEMARLYLASR